MYEHAHPSNVPVMVRANMAAPSTINATETATTVLYLIKCPITG